MIGRALPGRPDPDDADRTRARRSSGEHRHLSCGCSTAAAQGHCERRVDSRRFCQSPITGQLVTSLRFSSSAPAPSARCSVPALARQGASVSVVCRSDYDAVKRDGYDIRESAAGRSPLPTAHVYREAAECRVAAGLRHPHVEGADRASIASRCCDRSSVAHTVILLIQNGVDIEQEIADAFPANELLSSLAFVGVGRGDPGEVHHQSLGSLVLGRYPSGDHADRGNACGDVRGRARSAAS